MNETSPVPVIIPLSKTKIILLALGSLAFVALCSWILFTKDPHPRLHTWTAKIASSVGIVFFGLCGIYAAGKLADRKPGFIIDSEGIIDNSSAIAAGRIRWDDMTGLTVSTIHSTKILNILVQAPESYLEGRGRLARLAGIANIKMTGTPINISSNALKIKFDDLVQLISERAASHRNLAPHSNEDGVDVLQ